MGSAGANENSEEQACKKTKVMSMIHQSMPIVMLDSKISAVVKKIVDTSIYLYLKFIYTHEQVAKQNLAHAIFLRWDGIKKRMIASVSNTGGQSLNWFSTALQTNAQLQLLPSRRHVLVSCKELLNILLHTLMPHLPACLQHMCCI